MLYTLILFSICPNAHLVTLCKTAYLADTVYWIYTNCMDVLEFVIFAALPSSIMTPVHFVSIF